MSIQAWFLASPRWKRDPENRLLLGTAEISAVFGGALTEQRSVVRRNGRPKRGAEMDSNMFSIRSKVFRYLKSKP